MRRSYPKKSSMERIYKDLGNMLYGKVVCGISDRRNYDSRVLSMMPTKGNSLANPIIGSWITGFVRSLLAELLNKVDSMGGRICSVTTDGFVTNVKNLEDLIINESLDIVNDNSVLINRRENKLKLIKLEKEILIAQSFNQFVIKELKNISDNCNFIKVNYTLLDNLNKFSGKLTEKDYLNIYGPLNNYDYINISNSVNFDEDLIENKLGEVLNTEIDRKNPSFTTPLEYIEFNGKYAKIYKEIFKTQQNLLMVQEELEVDFKNEIQKFLERTNKLGYDPYK
ncbi:hypothetical protein L873DRAFT_1796596 [Choiromyces venosus 120613-1]|uniref:DNA-directed DNA polymerase n=1 Tax=Choiromyces venosus 120613-1 TaxID=1336337 RepID=A0A3N4IRV5_9PEZI|nr:hypothetical protein L873DRAFT_1796596 [Choiromyces venosus 120613-1]